jgi:hypothetical protein
MDYWMVKTDSMGLFQWNKRLVARGVMPVLGFCKVPMAAFTFRVYRKAALASK